VLALGLIVLIGGLILRLPPAITVVAAAFLVAGSENMGPLQTLDLLGKSFVDNRSLTLFLLTLPALGLCERHGLHRWAGQWIGRFGQGGGPGRVLVVYQALRVIQGALGVRINGHATFVRPLLAPMAEARATKDAIRPHCAVVENLGNFYGQNLNPAQPGLLLVLGTMTGAGVTVNLWSMAFYALVPVSFSLLLSFLRYRRWK
jgi:uncharacterized membrane protein